MRFYAGLFCRGFRARALNLGGDSGWWELRRCGFSSCCRRPSRWVVVLTPFKLARRWGRCARRSAGKANGPGVAGRSARGDVELHGLGTTLRRSRQEVERPPAGRIRGRLIAAVVLGGTDVCAAVRGGVT